MMRIQLQVRVNGEWWNGGAVTEVTELYRQTFAPLKTCDEPWAAFATGDILANSTTVETVMALREDAAKILSENLTRMILQEMQKNDTHNGYEKAERGRG